MRRDIMIILSLVVMLILVIFIPLIATSAFSKLANSEKQDLELIFHARNESGNPMVGVIIDVYMLTDKGRIFLGKTLTNEDGRGSIYISIPRKYVGDDKITKKPIYASVNLKAYAHKDNMVGSKTFPIDPTYMNWPFDIKEIMIKLRNIKKSNTAGISSHDARPQPLYNEYEYSYAYTQVLLFTTWDNISARYDYPIGGKIRIESKQCWWSYDQNGNLLNCSVTNAWESDGYTEVTLDRGIASPELSGRYVYNLYFEILYTHYTGGDPYLLGVFEEIYATDTSTDPRAYSRSTRAWDGTLPDGAVYYITIQGDTSYLRVTGGDNWVFSVSVSFGVSSNSAAGVSVALGVTKVPAPYATLAIHAGTYYENYAVKTVSPDGYLLKSYSNWVLSS